MRSGLIIVAVIAGLAGARVNRSSRTWVEHRDSVKFERNLRQLRWKHMGAAAGWVVVASLVLAALTRVAG
jgi:hypothetical protein